MARFDVGFSWKAPGSIGQPPMTSTVVSVGERDGVPLYAVRTEGSPFPTLHSEDDLAREVALDERRLASCASQQALALAHQAAEEDAASLDGFEHTLTPRMAAKAVEALTKTVRWLCPMNREPARIAGQSDDSLVSGELTNNSSDASRPQVPHPTDSMRGPNRCVSTASQDRKL